MWLYYVLNTAKFRIKQKLQMRLTYEEGIHLRCKCGARIQAFVNDVQHTLSSARVPSLPRVRLWGRGRNGNRINGIRCGEERWLSVGSGCGRAEAAFEEVHSSTKEGPDALL